MRRRLVLAGIAGCALLGACERNPLGMLERANRALSSTPRDTRLAQEILTRLIDDTALATDFRTRAVRRDALLARGQLFRSLGLLSPAESDFRAITETVDPDNPYANVALASVLGQRANPVSDDLNEAIRAAERALEKLPAYPPALVAEGLARRLRARRRVDEVVHDVRANASAESLAAVEEAIRVAAAVPADDPRVISVVRELERRIDLHNGDVRDRILFGLRDAREDNLRALELFLQGLGSMEDPPALCAFLEILTEGHRFEEAASLARVANSRELYHVDPFVADTISRTFERARLYEEAVDLIAGYASYGPFDLPFDSKRRLLQAAASVPDPALLERAMDAARKKLRRGPDRVAIEELVQYYEAIRAEKLGRPPQEIADKLEPVVRHALPEIRDVIPDAAKRLARAQVRLGNLPAALEACDVAVAGAIDAEAFALRASLILKVAPNDPLSVGGNLREAILAAPSRIEEFYPPLREAAERYLARSRQSLQRIEETALAQREGNGVPGGYIDGWLYYVVARDFLEQGKFREAVANSLYAYALDSDLKAALVVTGLARAALGEIPEARDALARAGDAIPDDPRIYRTIVESGAAPPEMKLRMLRARPDVEGRIVVAEALLERDAEAAARVLKPVADRTDAPPTARLLAARLVASRDAAEVEAQLAKIPPGPLTQAADQVRLEAAVERNDVAAAEALARRLQSAGSTIDVPSVARVIEHARLTGRAGAALPAAKLLAERGGVGDPDVLARLARAFREAGELRLAAECFDRVLGLRPGSDVALELGLVLHGLNERSGVAEALAFARQDWGDRPIDFRRAALAVLAGETPNADELAAVSASEEPLNVLVGAAFRATTGGTSFVAPQGAWVEAATRLAGTSISTAERALRAAVAVRTPGGELPALAEIAALRAGAADPFPRFLEGEALRALGRAREAVTAYTETARALPDLPLAWSRALAVARELDDDPLAQEVASAWQVAQPESREAYLASSLTFARERLARGESVDEIESWLAGELAGAPDDFELALTLLQARLRRDRLSSTLEAMRRVLQLAPLETGRTARAARWVVEALESGLPATAMQARDVEATLLRAVPDSPYPIRLRARRAIAEERFVDAGSIVLDYLRAPGRAKTLSRAVLKDLLDVLHPVDPVASAEIALVGVASDPADPPRWESLADELVRVGKIDDAIRWLEAIVVVNPTPRLRRALARLHAEPGQDGARALALLGEAASRPAEGDGDDSLDDLLARCRALVSQRRGAEALPLLQPYLGPTTRRADLFRVAAFAYAVRGSGDDLEAAAGVLEMAAALEPESVAAVTRRLAACFRQMHGMEPARPWSAASAPTRG